MSVSLFVGPLTSVLAESYSNCVSSHSSRCSYYYLGILSFRPRVKDLASCMRFLCVTSCAALPRSPSAVVTQGLCQGAWKGGWQLWQGIPHSSGQPCVHRHLPGRICNFTRKSVLTKRQGSI